MDVFSRTFLPATAEAGLSITVVSRHMPLVRRCVTPDETAVLVTRCHRLGLPAAGSFLLLLTNRRLVITRESRMLHRVQVHLASPLRHLTRVGWTADVRAGAVELAVAPPNGEQERWWIPARDPRLVRRLEALFQHTFSPRASASAPPLLPGVDRALEVDRTPGTDQAEHPLRAALSG